MEDDTQERIIDVDLAVVLDEAQFPEFATVHYWTLAAGILPLKWNGLSRSYVTTIQTGGLE